VRADAVCSVVKDATKENHTFDAFSHAKAVDLFGKRTLLAYTRCDCIPTDIVETVKKVSDALSGWKQLGIL
jgi:hypothetical protein